MSLAGLDATVQGRVLVARLEGEIDLSNVKAIRSSLLREMHNDLLGLLLDLTGLSYLDSVGIQVIYELREQLDTRGQTMRLVVTENSTIWKMLEIVDASKVVGIASTSDSAFAELAHGARPEAG